MYFEMVTQYYYEYLNWKNRKRKEKIENMVERSSDKYRQLEERTFIFAKRCRDYVKHLPRSATNREYAQQLTRASGSQAANYIEANEALSKKDFIHRVKICRKEAKECSLWLRLAEPGEEWENERAELENEIIELRKIFSAIIDKSM
jgi:four helix bundle protein